MRISHYVRPLLLVSADTDRRNSNRIRAFGPSSPINSRQKRWRMRISSKFALTERYDRFDQ
ncbi:hypothetical protein A4G99_21905 [Haladaptatus sp. R4]|nr:hypothetical protein A4G99_21905 [Haladaptatus sp. R4]